MSIWAWIQPVDRIWKVVSDNEKGTLSVFNEKNDLIMERKGMSKEELSFIEKNFLQIVATNLTASTVRIPRTINQSKTNEELNYMYA